MDNLRYGRLFAVLLSLILATTASSASRAETAWIAGRTLTVEPPSGYCALDRDDSNENEMYRVMERIQEGMNRVLVVFYDCAELRSMRAGKTDTFDRYGQILTPVREQAYPGIPRDIYFSELRAVFDQAFAIGARRGQENVKKVVPDMRVGEARNLGILEEDDAALYAGMLEKVAFEGKAFTVAAVVSMTLVHGVPLSVNLYRPYEGQESFDKLLEEQRRFMKALVQRNEQLEGRGQPPAGAKPNDG